jgi:hypothetical protein
MKALNKTQQINSWLLFCSLGVLAGSWLTSAIWMFNMANVLMLTKTLWICVFAPVIVCIAFYSISVRK